GVATAVDVDKGATVGLRWAKGPFAMMNAVGTRRALALVQAYAARWGHAFPVAPALQRLGAQNAPWDLPLVRYEKVEGRVAAASNASGDDVPRWYVGVLTVDRPDVLNALNAKVLQDFRRQAEAAVADPDVRVLVVTRETQ